MSEKIDRRNFIKSAGKAAIVMSTVPGIALSANSSFDVVIKGATILDGTGGVPFVSDLGITGDTITALGDISKDQAKRVIDASGFYLSPGFIDMHAHSDYSLPAYPTADSRVRQGITTEITGNCGGSAAPLFGLSRQESIKDYADDYGITPDWSDVTSYFASLEKRKISLNQAMLLGQGTLRSSILGLEDRKASENEMRALIRAVEEGMDQGAIGLSTGLEYSPGLFTPTEEIVAMTRVVARRNGLYSSHMRNEEANLLEAVNEAVNIGRLTGARVEISHLKAAGRPNWAKQQAAIDLVESARQQGIEVLADAYPYTAYSTGLTVLFLPWVLAGGTKPMMERLKDTTQRARIRKELIEYVTNDPGDYNLIVISNLSSDKNKNCIGLNIAQIADIWKIEPVDAILRLIEEEQGSVSYVGHAMSPENVELVLSNPLVMIGSDGYSMTPTGKALKSKPHPRSYGTYPRVLGYYVREKHLFSLPTAIKKMTSMPAEHAGISDRGRIARGKKADIVIFDANTVKEISTYEDPHRYPAGINYVIVNGVAVVENGNHTGARPGRVLRKA